MFTNGCVRTSKAVVQILDDFRQQILVGYKKASGLSYVVVERQRFLLWRQEGITKSYGAGWFVSCAYNVFPRPARKTGWKHRRHLRPEDTTNTSRKNVSFATIYTNETGLPEAADSYSASMILINANDSDGTFNGSSLPSIVAIKFAADR